jgi:hypothetical protein
MSAFDKRRVFLPRTDPNRLVISSGLLDIMDDDADVMNLVRDAHPGHSFTDTV